MILLLPMDVGNARTNGGLAMGPLWVAAFISAVVLIVIVLPFTIFYYEAEDPTEDSLGKRVGEGLKYSLVTLFVYCAITGVLWVLIGEAQVPYTRLKSDVVPTQIANLETCSPQPDCRYSPYYALVINPVKTSGILTYQVSPIIYGISILTLLGVILFVVFGGIGLAALPMDLFRSWKNRPRFIPAAV